VSPLKRTRIKSRRSKPRRRAGACREYLDWLKTQKCVITGKRHGMLYRDGTFTCGRYELANWRTIIVDPAHVRTKRLGGDLWNAVPLAHHLHEEQHRIGIKSFQAKYGVDLAELAREHTERWLQTESGAAWLAQHPEAPSGEPKNE